MSIFAYQALKGLQLTERAVLELMPKLDTTNFDVGQDIGAQGGACLHLVCDGLVMSSLSNGWSAPTPLDMYGPNTWVGGGALFGPQATQARYLCLAPSRIIRLPLAPAADYALAERSFLDFMVQLLRWRDGHHLAMVSASKSPHPGVRIALSLAILAQGVLCSHSHLPVAGQANGPVVQSNQSVIADYVGLSRSVVSRHLQELVGAGLMRLNYGSIEFLNTPAWQALYQAHVCNTLTSHRTLTDLFSFLHERVAA